MSDEGEKTCPLCAEEMDLTDQQLKPCKCGYEICVWCWHHVMEIAEKDGTEGRCPACRTIYDKERIVGTAAKCERLVAEINLEKKQKSHKAKTKTSESRKQLNSVRVIQRNLVYIVGLPLNLADEDLLQCNEYFALYGKVLKVSISRTSAGTIQQFPNNTCSVYITYSKEEEAVRCIQSVHGFILDGRPLRACFGTTKYCHSWLRNMPCSNPDCLYLHEIGSQEDSFTKDEIISAYSRSRVQQITGCTNNMQRRLGNVLPPPADDYCNNSPPVIGKPGVKNSSNNSSSSVRGSPPNSSSGRSGALPPAASWGARASSCNPLAGSLSCSNGPTKLKAAVISGSPALTPVVSSSAQAILQPSDGGKKLISNEEIHSRKTTSKLDMVDTLKRETGINSHSNVSEVSSAPSVAPAVKSTNQPFCPPPAESSTGDGDELPTSIHTGDAGPCSPAADKNLCSDISLMSIGRRAKDEHSDTVKPNGSHLGNFLSPGNRGFHWQDSEELQELSASTAATATASAVDPVTGSSDACDGKSYIHTPVIQNLTSETEDDFENQRLTDAIVVNPSVMSASSLHFLSHLTGPLQQHVDVAAASVDYSSNPPPIVNRVPDEVLGSNVSRASVSSNGFLDNFFNHAPGHDSPSYTVNVGQGNLMGKFEDGLHNVDAQPGMDMGESSIISDILDLDSWDESLTSLNLAKLLSETDAQESSLKLANPCKGQISNQSRFSFARQEESRKHLFDFESCLSNADQLAKNHLIGQAFVEKRDPYVDRLGNGFGVPQVSRPQISPPPGFAAPSRPPPPPGFTLHERNDQTVGMNSGSHLLETSAFLRNTYQATPAGNINTMNEVEFIDPAILAVGKGRLPSGVNNSSIDMSPNFHVQIPTIEDESRLLLMQSSLSPHQNFRYADVRDNFSLNQAYGFTSQHMEQSRVNNLSFISPVSLQQTRNPLMSNGHWDSWNEIPATNDSIVDLLRNDRSEFTMFGVTNSGDLYNRSFRM